jgi:hypothetical protein
MYRYPLNKENYFLDIKQDDNAESPDSWGNTDMFLVYDHKQCTIERDGFAPRNIYEYLEQCKNSDTIDLRNDDFDKYWIFTVYAYIHSGVSLSLSRGTDRFDTSSTGFILIEKEIGGWSIGSKPYIVTEPEATKYAEGLIETWNQYLSGEVYSFTVVELNKCKCCGTIEEIEHGSCGGFYGSISKELLNDMIGYTEYNLTSYKPQEAQT